MNFSSQVFRKSAIAVAFAALTSAAVAAPINVGDLNVPTIPAASLTSWSPGAAPATQVYFFRLLTDAGGLSANYNWTPPGATGVAGAFFNSNATGDILGASLASFVQDGSRNIDLSYGNLAAGYYAFRFYVNNLGGTAPTFSGQVSAAVPSPAVLGLVGLGLIGMGLGRKARRA